MENFTIYRDAPVRILDKGPHVHKVGGRLCGCIHKDLGDIPCATLNDQTGKMMAVVNNRGFAYARRNDIRLFNKKKAEV